jgi:peptidoglycan hydrolase-like protein with peptidoglycan-binding domain
MPSTIRVGSRGPDVVLCQESLTSEGYPCTADGIFGKGTESQVKAFQKDHGLDADGIVGPATWTALLEDSPGTPAPGPLPLVLQHAKSLGHEIWGDKNRLWLFGIRAPIRNANSFDDTLGCAWVDDDGMWNVKYWPGTTDPGSYYLLHPTNSKGCAVLVPNQYLDTYKIDLHGGKYYALCQRAGEVSVYRDNTMDDKIDLDPSTITTGYFGINLHAATQIEGGVSTEVNKWSAGCQVHAAQKGFEQMMELAYMQRDKTGRETFSYTLMDQWF